VKREQMFALKHGYVRAWTGPVRHMPELRYLKRNKNDNLIGAVDTKLYSKMFAGLKNEASNTTIQTAEVYQAMPDVTTIGENLKAWNFKSRIWNYVHDSIALYIYKREKDVVYALLNECAQINREPFYDLPMHLDVEESDLSLGEYYGKGRELSIEHYNLTEELDKWNKEHETNLKFISYIPL
jgi:DNA polymerase I-like protein with 3'-5' exonuclease and polymerase domains